MESQRLGEVRFVYFNLDWKLLPMLVVRWGGETLPVRLVGAAGDAGPSWQEMKVGLFAVSSRGFVL